MCALSEERRINNGSVQSIMTEDLVMRCVLIKPFLPKVLSEDEKEDRSIFLNVFNMKENSLKMIGTDCRFMPMIMPIFNFLCHSKCEDSTVLLQKVLLWVYGVNSPTRRIMENEGLFTNMQ
ncbi:hypothetical protein AVEN_209928-1 [Araneus ventricosus]|uniref:Uncharacterized protein n=1 Tax=Araneus ventricosus TaxID=182803 RepID=A0A4Y2DBH9_ARAVE|nr:hypothetical protein AVEN_209928-1 [Araneus ventricosus]